MVQDGIVHIIYDNLVDNKYVYLRNIHYFFEEKEPIEESKTLQSLIIKAFYFKKIQLYSVDYENTDGDVHEVDSDKFEKNIVYESTCSYEKDEEWGPFSVKNGLAELLFQRELKHKKNAPLAYDVLMNHLESIKNHPEQSITYNQAVNFLINIKDLKDISINSKYHIVNKNISKVLFLTDKKEMYQKLIDIWKSNFDAEYCYKKPIWTEVEARKCNTLLVKLHFSSQIKPYVPNVDSIPYYV